MFLVNDNKVYDQGTMTLKPTPTTSANVAFRRADFETLWQALDYAAKGDAGHNFFSAKGELQAVLSYRELRERAHSLARALANAGIARGERIVLIADTDPDFMIAFCACQYAGILPVPVAIPTSLGGRAAYIEQLRQQITGCGACAALSPESLVPFLQEAAADLGLHHVGSYKDFYALPEGKGELRPFAPDEIGYLQFSSGSTRFPKGIEISQRTAMANAYAITRDGLNILEGDRCTSWLPLYHDMGLVGFMLVPLTTQMSVDYMATRDFARRSLTWLKLISEHGGTLSYSPSFGYDLCTRRMRENVSASFDLRTWRGAGIGGDMVQHHILQRFSETFAPFGFSPTAFVPSYGMAETTLAMSFAPLGQPYMVDEIDRAALAENYAVPAAPGPSARKFIACGRALIGHSFEIRDDRGQVLPERRIGRIFFKGPSVMSGYYRQPALTKETLSADGWLDTGDLGYLVEGQIVITGRAKDLIIIHGRNIWPQDLEWAAEELPDLRRGDTAAFSIENEEDGEHIVILAQCRITDPAQREAFKKNIAGHLQRAMAVEVKVVLVPPHGLPQTSSGKLSRAKAKANYLGGVYGLADSAQQGEKP